jgi:group I intron endonuclease
MHFIYAYENKINGKIYVGQTNNLHKRDKAHRYNQHNIPIDSAIAKHGRDNFDYWIISIVETVEQANQEEIFWILTARALLGENMVYNLSNGGDASMRGRKHSPETIEKMSVARRKEKNANWGKRKPGFTNSGSFVKGHKPTHNHKGKTWKLIDGKRAWMDIIE